MKLSRRAVLGTLAASPFSCHSPPPESRATRISPMRMPQMNAPRPKRTVVVLVAIDGVRHQDIYGATSSQHFTSRQHLIPELCAMERAGVALGAPESGGFFASGPNFVSLPGYMEMLSGTSNTRCTENDCLQMHRTTLLDEFCSRSGKEGSAAAISSWQKIGIASSKNHRGVVSTGRFAGHRHQHLQELPQCREILAEGKMQTGGHGSFRSDAITARLARAYLKEAQPDFLFLGLGETDEAGHQGDYEKYLGALNHADQVVGHIRSDLRAMRSHGVDTLLVVTTDHGRARNFRDHGRRHPESAQGFLFAEGSLVAGRGRLSHPPAYLKDIAPTIRAVTGLAPVRGPEVGRVLSELV